MNDFDLTLSLNSAQLPVKVHTHVEGETTWYDLIFENYTLSIYKDTLYTWTSDDPHGLSQADLQSIGEQIENVT
ncbi:MAG: hypothetical protein JWR67_823 [Mucilaginibacter sp.]|jgi:hypothetical protein|nr:hypothetical protein [Mucilaginibacter sp.]